MNAEIIERESRDGMRYAVKLTRRQVTLARHWVFWEKRYEDGFEIAYASYDCEGFPRLWGVPDKADWFGDKSQAQRLADLTLAVAPNPFINDRRFDGCD